MLKRFQLESKSRYEKLVIAQRLSDMLDKFLDGRIAPLRIGAEQGGIADWDDVVIHHNDEHWEHLQIKRQTSCFSDKHIDKAEYLASYKPRNTLKDIGAATETSSEEKRKPPSEDKFDSELEKVLKSLAVWQPSVPGVKPSKRTFSLTLPGPEVAIKGKAKEIITINQLRDVWNLCCKDGVDTDALSQRRHKPTQNVYTWLTTWCGFKDWDHVVEKMQVLEIHCIGDESTLETRAIDSLGRHFKDPAITLSVLLDYISDSTTDTNAVSCHTAVKHLQKLLRTDVKTWTQYLVSPIPCQGWIVTGTHDLGSTPTVAPCHPASQIVTHYWADTVPNRNLLLHADYVRPVAQTTSLISAILRLALHLKTGSNSLLLGMLAWRQGANNELGSTLGVKENDIDDLPWFDNTEALSCAMGRELLSPVGTKDESDALHSAMDALVWQQLQYCIEKKLNEIADYDLSAAMAEKWQIWRGDLDSDPDARLLFFEQMMYPQTEGINTKHALRIGPRTVELMETAIVMLLLTCVGLDIAGAHWRSIPTIGDVLSIAVRYWSGEASDHAGPRLLSEDSLRQVLGQSPPCVVILSGVDASATDLLGAGMAEDFEVGHSMAAERQPRLLVTRFQVYRQLRAGSLVTLQAHFQKHWNAWRLAREAAIEACGKGY
ncbi:ABC-three component system protein [Salinicola endophyticus]|uniref:ABC-three component system protein n=1 Tax=Salinicola endophyticus TaxID=1949083 RepID=UPI00130071F3|nr:ABC-three component system protein [Salinicola endophyticus]